MNVGILGIRGKYLSNEERDKAMQTIVKLTEKFDNPKLLTVHSPNGGINALVEMYAQINQINHQYYDYGVSLYDWKEANLQLAEDCDVLFSISTKIKNKKCHHCLDHTHEATGACYPLKLAKQMGKKTKVIIL
jgi:hypothetical protein